MHRILIALAALILAACATPAPQLVIAEDAESVRPIAVGASVPAFTVYDVDGDPKRFGGRWERPALFVVYRGGWCPYCNTQLADLRRVIPELRAAGMDVFLLSGDRPEILYSSLQDETQEAIDGLDYQILSDADLEASGAFGIAFRVSPEMVERMRAGLDVGGSSVELHGALPVPAVIMVDTQGEVAYRFVEPDYKVRLPAREVRAAAEKVLAENA